MKITGTIQIDGLDHKVTIEPVPVEQPPIDCVLSEWSEWIQGEWSPCVAGKQTRTDARSRTVVTQPEHGGAACGPLVETRDVSQDCEMPPPPPVDCVLSDWSEWSDCVNGKQSRTRTIVTQPANGGVECGPLIDVRDCTVEPPPPPPVIVPSGPTNFAERAAPDAVYMALPLASMAADDINGAGRKRDFAMRGLEPGPDGKSMMKVKDGWLYAEQPPNQSAGWGGSFFANIVDRKTGKPVRFGSGSRYYVAVDFMVSREFLSTDFKQVASGEPIGRKVLGLLPADMPEKKVKFDTSTAGKFWCATMGNRPALTFYNYAGNAQQELADPKYGTEYDLQPRGGKGLDRVLYHRDTDNRSNFYAPPALRGRIYPLECMTLQVEHSILRWNSTTGMWDTHVKAWLQRENLPAELFLDFDMPQPVEGDGFGQIDIMHYLTGLKVDGSWKEVWIKWRNLIASRERIADAYNTPKIDWLEAAPVDKFVSVPHSIPLSYDLNPKDWDSVMYPPWHPSSWNTWSGNAYDYRMDELLRAADGGHSASEQDGGYKGSARTGEWSVIQESTRYRDRAPENKGKAYFGNGRPQSRHTGYSNQLAYVDGARVVVLAHNTAGTFWSDAPPATTGFWPDREGEKYDLNGKGWAAPDFGSDVYPGFAMDLRNSKLYGWDGRGDVSLCDLNLTPRTWALVKKTAQPGHSCALVFDLLRGLLVSFSAVGKLGIKTLNPITGEFKVIPFTGTGAQYLIANGYTQAVHDTKRDEYVFLSGGPGWGKWITVDPKTSVATLQGDVVPPVDTMMGKAGYLPNIGVVYTPDGAHNIQAMRR